LVLKNRQNKNQRQRVIMFIGSPVKDDTKELVKLGKLLKKNNVAVDIINFGLENGPLQRTKLEEFINAVNSSDNSHLVHVPPGPHQLSDMVMVSPIMVEPAAARTGPTPAGGAAAAASGATPAAAAARPPGAEDEDELLAMVCMLGIVVISSST
jgi:26S proteasome regulatory subunit N10